MDTPDHIESTTSPEPEAQPSVQAMADIMALDFDEHDPLTTQSHPNYGMADRPDDLDGHQEEEIFTDEFDPEKNRTIVGLAHSGFAKTALVVGGSLAVITGSAALFQSRIPKAQVAQAPSAQPSKESALSEAQAAVTKAQQSESETKAQLALAQQKSALGPRDSGTKPAPENPSPTAPNPEVRVAAAPASGPITVVPLTPVTGNRSALKPISPRPISPKSLPSSTAARPTPPRSSDLAKSAAPTPTVPRAQLPPTKSAPAQLPLASMARTASQKPEKGRDRQSRDGQPENIAARPPGQQAQPVALAAARRPLPGADSYSPPPLAAALGGANPELAAAPTPGRSLRDYFRNLNNPNLNNPVAAPGVAPVPVAAAAPPVQPVTVPGMGTIAKTSATPERAADKILQQLAWSLPQRPKFLQPDALPSNSPTLAQGIQLAQGLDPGAAPQANVAVDAGANSTRPAFYNSLVTKAIAPKPEVVKLLGSDAETIAQGVRRILVGTSAAAEAGTPILWNAGHTSTAKFILKLTEPIRDNTDRVAIPAGSQLVVVVKPAGANIGFAELEVIGVIIHGMEFAPPTGMLAVRDDQNGLLVGEDYFRREAQVASRDSLTMFTGALGRVGQVLNQPRSTFTTNGLGGTTAITNQEPNILGAVLEGGFRDLATTWSQRNQQAVQEILTKPNVYQIPKGRLVRIFVNQTLEF